jgi:hypothetical protein
VTSAAATLPPARLRATQAPNGYGVAHHPRDKESTMCGCFVLMLGAFAPRLALALMALFNDEITKAFDGSWVIPLIGWFLVPYTTLTYVLISWWTDGGVSGFEWVFVGFAFFLDIASYGGGYNRRADLRYPSTSPA